MNGCWILLMVKDSIIKESCNASVINFKILYHFRNVSTLETKGQYSELHWSKICEAKGKTNKQTNRKSNQTGREEEMILSSKFKLRKKNKHRITLSFNGSEQNCFVLLRHNYSLNLLDEKVCYNSQESWSLEEEIERKVVWIIGEIVPEVAYISIQGQRIMKVW